MTGFAWREYATVVKSGAAPGLRGVAIIADITADDMLCMFAWCAAVVVTKDTFHRSAFELSAKVTTGAVDKFVLTGEWKTGCEMVEVFQAFSKCCCVKPGYCNEQQRQASRG